jgi:hypothetical protein
MTEKAQIANESARMGLQFLENWKQSGSFEEAFYDAELQRARAEMGMRIVGKIIPGAEYTAPYVGEAMAQLTTWIKDAKETSDFHRHITGPLLVMPGSPAYLMYHGVQYTWKTFSKVAKNITNPSKWFSKPKEIENFNSLWQREIQAKADQATYVYFMEILATKPVIEVYKNTANFVAFAQKFALQQTLERNVEYVGAITGVFSYMYERWLSLIATATQEYVRTLLDRYPFHPKYSKLALDLGINYYKASHIATQAQRQQIIIAASRAKNPETINYLKSLCANLIGSPNTMFFLGVAQVGTQKAYLYQEVKGLYYDVLPPNAHPNRKALHEYRVRFVVDLCNAIALQTGLNTWQAIRDCASITFASPSTHFAMRKTWLETTALPTATATQKRRANNLINLSNNLAFIFPYQQAQSNVANARNINDLRNMLIDVTGQDKAQSQTPPQVAEALQALAVLPENTYNGNDNYNLQPDQTSPENPHKNNAKRTAIFVVLAIVIAMILSKL